MSTLKIDMKGVTSCPVTPALYIRYIYTLFLNIFYFLFSLLLYCWIPCNGVNTLIILKSLFLVRGRV